MRFGPVPIDEALGAKLAHSRLLPDGRRLVKGAVLARADIERLRAAGIEQVVVARLEPSDVEENEAAARLGAALVQGAHGGLRATPARTGRVNLHATRPGLVHVCRETVNALNAVDPMITLATLGEWAQVAQGDLVATVKIISYAVAQKTLSQACVAAGGALDVVAPVMRRASLIQTGGPGKLAEKGRRAVARRLAAFGGDLIEHVLVDHDTEALAGALATAGGDLILILTRSATSDMGDVGPQALLRAGGRVERFGMPVDPGNLLFVGELRARPVIGLPGCARSMARNGADLVLGRILCGLPAGSREIAAMGVGGLLKESPARPSPREPKTT